MTHSITRTEFKEAVEPSEEFLSLVLEIDSALHAGRAPQLAAEFLQKLSEIECIQLEKTRRQLELLYSQPATTQLPAASGETGIEGTAADDDGDFRLTPDLEAFLGIQSSQFGRFEVLRGLGMGGHGVVFLARDPILDRLVALKVPRPDVLVNRPLRKRFLAEGRAAALLTHPNIVTVYESNAVGSICYLAQDYIPGPSLADWLRDHPEPVSPRCAASLIQQLAQGVEAAHSRQILHRDIKPGNVLLAPTSTEIDRLDLFQPKLADFGMAKLLQDRDQTKTGGVIGTPAYMAPEQAAGRKDLIGTAADIYSLGAVLYELLTHRPVHRGESDLETLQRVLQREPVPPRVSLPEIPRDLEAICLKCLRREPQDRYGSALDLANDLQRFLEGRPVQARPQSVATATYRWARRNPLVAALCSAVVVAVFAALGISLWYNSRLNESLQVVQRHERDLRAQTQALRRRVYADDLNLAAKAWTTGDADQVRKRLELYIPDGDEPDLRTFPWWLLWRLSQESSQVVAQHAGRGTSAAINSTGDLAASAGSDGIIRLWKIPEGTSAGELHGHDRGSINSLEFAPRAAGHRLVSASDDGTVRIWDIDSLTAEGVLTGHQGWVATARFLGTEGAAIATAGEDKLIRIWNTKSGELLREIAGHTDIVRGLCENPHEHLLVSSSEDGTIRAWDWHTGLPDLRITEGKLEMPEKTYARTVCFNHDYQFLAAGFRNEDLYIWDMQGSQRGQLRHATHLDSEAVRTVDWRDDDSLLVATHHSILLGREVVHGDFTWETLNGHSEKVMSIKAAANGGVVSADDGGTVRWWSQKELDGDVTIHSQSDFPDMDVKWTKSLIILRMKGDDLFSLPLPKLSPIHHTNHPRMPGCMSQDGTIFFAMENLQNQEYFSAFTTAERRSIWRAPLGDHEDSHTELSPDGRTVVLCLKPDVWLIDVETGRRQLTLAHPDKTWQVAFSQDESVLITACADGNVRIWDLRSGTLQKTHRVHHDAVFSVSLSQDDQLLATSSDDRKVRVWRLTDWKEIAAFSMDLEEVDVELLDDGETLATVDNDALRFWSVRDQVQVMQLDYVRANKERVGFSPDRKSIALQNGRRLRLIRGAP